MNEQYTVVIESVDFEGKGISRIDGKTVFIDGALTGEEVIVEIVRRKPSFDKAKIVEIIKPSPERVEPACPNFGICGGCSMQHASFEEQIRIKEKVLIDNLKHIGNVETREVILPLKGIPWGYRHRGRLSARYVTKKGGMLVGFREKSAPYVVDMNECHVLPKHVSDMIPELRKTFNQFTMPDKIPQIEVAVGTFVTVLVVRNMETLSDTDEALLKEFADANTTTDMAIQIWLQPKGPDSCYPLYPIDAPKLSYEIKRFTIEMPYYPTEFTQVNSVINEAMVSLAIDMLDAKDNEVVADFFCGIGNFTLPIATSAKQVIGIEGSDALVKRAKENAMHNGLDKKVAYQVCNLFTIDDKWLKNLGSFDKWLIDPPRDGAMELVKSITSDTAPKRIVYVSCNPATLARDADILVNTHGYTLLKSGVMNMFPHTSHVESIALFELQ
ncbi:MAG: 23S rRNA (uracil(1939)-C(5))-methyltransferase RlmD [Burkholderiales bacterium]|nr:23S rRNA (uracil(1939)-C(5))-methyltransferase RlmD [Burkholderiales bacterium]